MWRKKEAIEPPGSLIKSINMLDEIKGLDIYLLDQLLKDRIEKESTILDAGCGSGRNMKFLLNNGYQVSALDPDESKIQSLRSQFPEQAHHFHIALIEDNEFENETFDFIICCAVLHFAKNHEQFYLMFEQLTNLLSANGILFIRMTSTIGMENQIKIDDDGRSRLPDGTDRYVIRREQIIELCQQHQLTLIDPIKSVKVDELRSMTTFVLQKSN